MGPGPLLEGLHQSVIDAAHQQVSHGNSPRLVTMLTPLAVCLWPRWHQPTTFTVVP
jgi:hypothetical protein